jgi:hypothetical protein
MGWLVNARQHFRELIASVTFTRLSPTPVHKAVDNPAKSSI